MIPFDPVPAFAVDGEGLPLWSWWEVHLLRLGAAARLHNLTPKIMEHVRRSLLPRAIRRRTTGRHALGAPRAGPRRSPRDGSVATTPGDYRL
jgi:hypothetical protein